MVHRKPPSYLIIAVLVFQLAMGMNWPMAHAAAAGQQSEPRGMDMAHCSEHASAGQPAEGPPNGNAQVDGSVGHDPSHTPQPLAKHDCCRFAGCQCHSAFTPGIVGPANMRVVVSLGCLLPMLDARAITSRPDDFFRPPIA